MSSCYNGSFNESKVREVLRIPGNLRVVVLLAVGYPSAKENLAFKVWRKVRKRKALEELVSLEEYCRPCAVASEKFD
ncbi:TPA: hypothetical protein HA274_00855 [Candidatus Bathyarchaeota archaeon]|nr:hypothetical protein [Candidatus Bathyarchaeota archaeon]